MLLISESWERENLTLDKIINLEDHTVISNVHQRIGQGGRPAIIANHTKFHVKNLTNTVVQVPWGVEAVWCLLTPRKVRNDNKVQCIACCAIYSKPNSNRKTLLLDHISDAFNILSTKFGRGLHFVLAGDTNDLKLDPILSLSPNFQQIVKKWTRLDPPAILDPVVTTLARLYQEPQCLDPLDADPDKNGSKSDHRIVLVKPISTINNKSARQSKLVKTRPMPQSGIDQMKSWFIDQDWDKVYQAESADQKAEIFQTILTQKLDEIFPEKVRKFNSDDQPWVSHKLKQMDRRRKRIYHKQRRSEKWRHLDKAFKEEMKSAKAKFYQKAVEEIKVAKPSQWYSFLKKISSHDQHKSEIPVVEEINHLPDQAQAEVIADQFTAIQNEYNPINKDDISIPSFEESSIPQFHPSEVWLALSRIDANKATCPGDFPARLIKLFAAYITEPLTHIFNVSLKSGKYPKVYKFEICTPVPKVHPTEKVSQLHNISGLLNFDKIFEKLIAQLMISDMDSFMDPAQYGNKKGVSIQHYLIKMIHKILKALDNNKHEAFAVIASLIDWNNAFPRQCPTLGIKAFIDTGVRSSLIPVLVDYFSDRQMSVKWRGHRSEARKINGGGPQGATIGILEYLAQSNKSAECVSEANRFRFIDDLSVLEIINLLTVGLTSFNIKGHVPSHIPSHNQFIPPENLESQKWLNQINQWTKEQKMMINEQKTKNIIFNFTRKYQFTTRLTINDEPIEELKSTRLLGTVIQSDLNWDMNTAEIVRKANARMQLLRKIVSFGAPIQDLKQIYILFIRSLLEQSATVWHSSLSLQNITDIERVQKSACKLILGEKYENYQNALLQLDMLTLSERREELCINFAKKCVKNPKTASMFPLNTKKHGMNTRKFEKYHVEHANHERFRKSAIIYMQNLLNQQDNDQK